MTFQHIRHFFEGPVIAALAAQGVDTYVDNQSFVESDAASEYAVMRLDFGVTTDVALGEPAEAIQGNIVVEVYTPKGRGPGRGQTLITEAMKALNNLKPCTGAPTATGARGRVLELVGPSFFALEGRPHYLTRVGCGFRAAYTEP